MPLRKDIWRPAIVALPAAEIYARGTLHGAPWRWLPEESPFRFLADPFGLWRDGLLHVFAERFDYRDRIGRIDVLVYDRLLTLLATRPVLAEPWHLSYPFVFEAEGETWMLPEAHRSGGLTLYRAADFPARWEPTATIALDAVAIDASITRHEDRWWLFYSPATDPTGSLHVAFAGSLTGRWTPHPRNPVRTGKAEARPGGTPLAVDGGLILPVQDCSTTYGGAIRPLRINRLTPDRFEATLGEPIVAPRDAQPFDRGLHTITAAGPVTLVDVKRTVLSPRGLAIELRRHARTLLS